LLLLLLMLKCNPMDTKINETSRENVADIQPYRCNLRWVQTVEHCMTAAAGRPEGGILDLADYMRIMNFKSYVECLARTSDN
jgi:hypothetical protein